MLTIENLQVKYDSHLVINDLSLELETNQVHGLIGLNGSGKTTLLNTLYHFVKPSKGEILWENQPLTRNKIALLPTQNYFYHNITAKEYLSLFPKAPTFLSISEWENRFQIPLDEIIDGYSTGMKKKLALLGVMHLDKPIIILDEPFNGLDLESNFYLGELIKIWKSAGKTLIITSHVLETLFSSCDKIHWLRNGKIEKSFSKEDFGQIDEKVFKELREQ